MFPGLGGMNPKKMQGMMKQLGINQEDIPAERVIIEKEDGMWKTLTWYLHP